MCDPGRSADSFVVNLHAPGMPCVAAGLTEVAELNSKSNYLLTFVT